MYIFYLKKDPSEKPVNPEVPDPSVLLVTPDNVAQPENADLPENLEPKEPKDAKANVDHRDLLVSKAILIFICFIFETRRHGNTLIVIDFPRTYNVNINCSFRTNTKYIDDKNLNRT